MYRHYFSSVALVLLKITFLVHHLFWPCNSHLSFLVFALFVLCFCGNLTRMMLFWSRSRSQRERRSLIIRANASIKIAQLPQRLHNQSRHVVGMWVFSRFLKLFNIYLFIHSFIYFPFHVTDLWKILEIRQKTFSAKILLHMIYIYI